MSTEQPTAYLHDGYTRNAYIAPLGKLYPAMRFTFRPVLTQDRSFIFDKINRAEPRKAEAMAAQAIRKHIVEWDIVKGDGTAVELEESEILHLQPRLFQRLYRIVMGDEWGDDDPDEQPVERDAATDAEWQEMMLGSAAKVEEADTKN